MLLAGCITDNRTDCGGGTRGTISVRLTVSSAGASTRAALEEAGAGAENNLRDIVVMVFGDSNDGSGLLEVCEHFVLASLPPEQDRWEDESTLLVSNVTGLALPKNVYVIANWNGYSASNYVVGTTEESAVLAELTSISGPIATPAAASPMLMSGRVAGHIFANSGNKATVGMSRQPAKIRLRVEFDSGFTGFYGSRLTMGGAAGDARMRPVNVPDRSYVVGRTPAAAPSSAAAIHYPFTRAMENHASFFADSCYVYENPVQGNTTAARDESTSLILHIPYILDGTANSNNYYRLYIDNTAEDAANPYPTVRNHIYDIKVTVKGFGLPEELAVPDALESEMTIADWGDIDFSADLETDNTSGSVDGTVDDWNDNGSGTGSEDIGPEDPETEIDDTGGNGTIDPWDPNGSGTDL